MLAYTHQNRVSTPHFQECVTIQSLRYKGSFSFHFTTPSLQNNTEFEFFHVTSQKQLNKQNLKSGMWKNHFY